MDDLSDAVEYLESGDYDVTRRAPPTTVRGRKVPGTATTFPITASVQPASGLVIQRLPEGRRNRETMVVFTPTELKTEENTQEADVIAIDGGTFEVESVDRWAALGNYYRAVVTRRPGT